MCVEDVHDEMFQHKLWMQNKPLIWGFRKYIGMSLKQSTAHIDNRHETNDNVHTAFFTAMFHTQWLHVWNIYLHLPRNSSQM